jgi:hypothetical protein
MIIYALIIFYLLGFSIYSMVYGIGVIPNASDVYAKVKEKYLVDEKVAKVTLQVLEAKDYRSMPNFVKDKIGKNITITVAKDDLPYFQKDMVNVLVSLDGDQKQQFYTARIKP